LLINYRPAFACPSSGAIRLFTAGLFPNLKSNLQNGHFNIRSGSTVSALEYCRAASIFLMPTRKRLRLISNKSFFAILKRIARWWFHLEENLASR
jgi:hypothetical protein